MKQFLRESDEFFREYMPDVTRKTFYALVFVFLAANLLVAILPDWLALRLFILRPGEAVLQANIWQFATYMFSHLSLLHLFGNVLGLFFFGGLVERQMGSRRFLWFILAAGVAAGIVHTITAFILGRLEVGVIGFSGALFAILTAAVIWFPRMRVLVMFLFPVPLRLLAAIFGFLMLLNIWETWRLGGPFGSGISDLAHLTGILVGILLVKNPGLLDRMEGWRIPFLMRPQPRVVRGRTGMGHPGRHSDPDDLYDDPHWKLDQ